MFPGGISQVNSFQSVLLPGSASGGAQTKTTSQVYSHRPQAPGLQGFLLWPKFHMGNLELHLKLKGEVLCRPLWEHQGWGRWSPSTWLKIDEERKAACHSCTGQGCCYSRFVDVDTGAKRPNALLVATPQKGAEAGFAPRYGSIRTQALPHPHSVT